MRREYTQITNLEMENSKLKDEITFLINQLNITKEQLSKVMQELTHIHNTIENASDNMELGLLMRKYHLSKLLYRLQHIFCHYFRF